MRGRLPGAGLASRPASGERQARQGGERSYWKIGVQLEHGRTYWTYVGLK